MEQLQLSSLHACCLLLHSVRGKRGDGDILCVGEFLIASDILALHIIRVLFKGAGSVICCLAEDTCGNGLSVRRGSGNFCGLSEPKEEALFITLWMVKSGSEAQFFVLFDCTFLAFFSFLSFPFYDTGGGKVFILAAHKKRYPV